ncbi:hypothetical protein NQ095_05825 [Rossellomorea sp. SC111]|uniref:hypothetical protein n=1 Tax=Rossellomorea sp. SC111 TaxID=2968985 RepID=UPI00215B5C35|nr:hypothetical protein [Rossellomorea sp. SC111]MCR8847918.1 hypothetical protein [Rossellomorea sp. SC111]
MKKVAIALMMAHFIIFILWIMNSGYLFSPIGIAVWIVMVIAGFFIQKKLDNVMTIRTVLAVSNVWMVFLMGATVFIYFAVSSMP